MSNRHPGNRGGHMPPPPAPVAPQSDEEVADEGLLASSDAPEAPAAEEKKPVMTSPRNDSQVAVKAQPKKGIEVKANRAGIWKFSRKSVGDIFHVPDMSKVGTWMTCTDKALEAQHQAEMLKKKKAASAK